MPDEVKLEPWPLFGYAPGNYSISCYRCKAEAHDCDKRAIACLPCAVEQAKRHIAAIEAAHPTAATDDVVKEELLDLLELGGDYAADVFNAFRDKASPCAKRVEANLERFNKARAALARTGVTLNG